MRVGGSLGGHDAELVAVDGERATLLCATPFAPGKPTTMVLAVEPPLALQLKAIGSKKADDGRFEVKARIVMLRRDERERLDALSRARDDDGRSPST